MYNMLRVRGISSVVRNILTFPKPVQINFYSTFQSKEDRTKCMKREFPAIVSCRSIKIGSSIFSEEAETEPPNEEESAEDPDLYPIIPVETSIRYLKSKAYKTTYGDDPVWVKYRRNFKGPFVPKRTRESCIRKGKIDTGSPCPICRDEYLVLHYTNVDLLKQFIHPQTGEIYDCRKIHVCQKQILNLEVAIKLAKFHGLLTYQVPFRNYDYKEYYPGWKE